MNTTEVQTPTLKQRVEHILRQLPDDCTLADVRHGLDVLEHLMARVEEADSGSLVPHDEVRKRFEKCLSL